MEIVSLPPADPQTLWKMFLKIVLVQVLGYHTNDDNSVYLKTLNESDNCKSSPSSYSRYKYRVCHHSLCHTAQHMSRRRQNIFTKLISVTILIPGHGVSSCGQSCACLTCPCPAFPNGPSWTRSVSPSVTLDFREALETATVGTSCSLKGFHELKSKFVM